MMLPALPEQYRKIELRVYKCDQCDKEYPNVRDLISHQGTHTGECPYVCDYCQKGYKTKLNLQNHIRMHLGEGFPCKSCDRVCPSAFLLKQHMRWHVKEKKFSCELCGKTFKVVEQLKSHVSHFHSDQAFSCSLCPRKLCSSKSLEKHLETHVLKKAVVQKMLDCPHCSCSYMTPNSLRRHLVKHEATSEVLFECSDCGEKFLYEDRLKYHWERNHSRLAKHDCIYCGAELESQEVLNRHVTEHRKSGPAACDYCGGPLFRQHWHTSWDKQKNLDCPRCSAKFQFPTQLLEHARVHGDDPAKLIWACETCGCHFVCQNQYKKHLVNPHPRTPGAADAKFPCGSCNETFESRELLKNHVKAHVSETNGVSVDLMCLDCGKMCASMPGFNAHRRRHFETNFFPCVYCTDIFKSLSTLRLHTKLHLKRSTLVRCNLCDTQCREKASLIQHLKGHSADVCWQCFTSFPTHDLYAAHKQMHSLPPECSICHVKFDFIESLRRHVEEKHNCSKLYLCTRCNLALRNAKKLKDHEKKHVEDDSAEAEKVHATRRKSQQPDQVKCSDAQNPLETYCTCPNCKPVKLCSLSDFLSKHAESNLSSLHMVLDPRLFPTVNDPLVPQAISVSECPGLTLASDASHHYAVTAAPRATLLPNVTMAPLSTRDFMSSFLGSEVIATLQDGLKSSRMQYIQALHESGTMEKVVLSLPAMSPLPLEHIKSEGHIFTSRHSMVQMQHTDEVPLIQSEHELCEPPFIHNSLKPLGLKTPSLSQPAKLELVQARNDEAEALEKGQKLPNSLLKLFLELLIRILGQEQVRNLSLAIMADMGGFMEKFLPTVKVNAMEISTEDTIWLFIQSMVYLFGGENLEMSLDYEQFNCLDSRSLMNEMLQCINGGLL